MRPFRTAVFGIICSGLIAPAFGQVDPARLLGRCDEVVRRLDTISYDARREGVGAHSIREPTAQGRVLAARNLDDPDQWMFAVGGVRDLPVLGSDQPFRMTRDTTSAACVLPRDETMVSASREDADELFEQQGALGLISWLDRWNDLITAPIVKGERDIPLYYEGEVFLNDERCHVVRADYSVVRELPERDVWWYIDVDDLLPRRIESALFDPQANAAGFSIVTLSSVEGNAMAPQGLFTIDVPENYEQVEFQSQRRQEQAAPATVPGGVAKGDKAPEWRLRTPEGKWITLHDYAGAVVVMDFWATWCGPCKMAMPSLQELHLEMKDKGVRVVGVACWENADPAAYMKQQGFTYDLVVDGDDTAAAYGVSGIPTIYVVGVDGTVIHKHVGFAPNLKDELKDVITKHLAEHPAGL